jgi:hypothetical protein
MDLNASARDRLNGQIVVAVAWGRITRYPIKDTDDGELECSHVTATWGERDLERHIGENLTVRQVNSANAAKGYAPINVHRALSALAFYSHQRQPQNV